MHHQEAPTSKTADDNEGPCTGPGTRDVLERPYTVAGGGLAPRDPLPPLLPFQCFRPLRPQEAGTIGGPKDEGGPSQTPFRPPFPPF